MAGHASYYWSGGEKVPLEDDPRVAIDVVGAERARLWDGDLADTAAGSGARVTPDVVLVPGTELSADLRSRLEAAGAVHPVFRTEDQTVVVLPEVRVETSDRTTLEQMRAAVRDWDVAVEAARPGRFVLTPGSHRGAEALSLANHVTETVGPAAAQARFLRITPDRAPDDHCPAAAPPARPGPSPEEEDHDVRPS